MTPSKWVAIGIDPVKDTVMLMGFADTLEESQKNEKRPRDNGEEAFYHRSFNLLDWKDCGENLFAWLMDSGFTTDDATQMIRDIGDELLRLLKPEKE